MGNHGAAPQGYQPLGTAAFDITNSTADSISHATDGKAVATDYRQRARMHAPTSLEDMTKAAHDLVSRGLGDHDVASILQIDVNSARRLIGAGWAK